MKSTTEARLERALERARRQRVRIRKTEDPARFTTRSKSNSDVRYRLTADTVLRCECLGYRYYGVCKHLAGLAKRLQREGRLPQPAPKPARKPVSELTAEEEAALFKGLV